MADISSLGELRPVEPLDLDAYADNREFTSIPKAGRYVVQAPAEFPSTAFSRTKAGALSAQVDPTILGPTNEGFRLRFVKVSAKTFKRAGISVSQLGDYLRACGFRGRLENEIDLANAVEGTVNQTYQVDLDWRAYNKNTGFSLEGMERFPSDGNGGHQSWTEDPVDKDETGAPVKLRAQVIVSRYVPATT